MNQVSEQPLAFPPRRTVVHAEALAWLDANPALPGTSVITSMPDVSEVPQFGFDLWRAWFSGAARKIIRWVPDEGVAIFFQSDIFHAGSWVDKGYLVQRAAEAEGATLIWHKIVCRMPPGTITMRRASYSHMLCFSRKPRLAPERPGPDVIPDAGYMTWRRAMGEGACRVACRFLSNEIKTRVVVDPFCGEGAILAVANSFGFEAIGVDLSVKRCRTATEQTLRPRGGWVREKKVPSGVLESRD